MFDTVIVPLDGSPHAEFAIPYAIDEARRHGAGLVLIHVIARPEPCTSAVRRSGPLPWQGEWPFEDLQPTKRDARAYLRSVVARYGLPPRTRQVVAVGDPGVRVATEARRHPRPLVVMLSGDSTREPAPPLSLVASYLLVAAAVPVLAIRQPPPPREGAIPSEAGASPAPARMIRPGPARAPGPPAPPDRALTPR